MMIRWVSGEFDKIAGDVNFDPHDPASTIINRSDWDLTWNVPLETGGVLVGETVKISIELEIVNQEETLKASV